MRLRGCSHSGRAVLTSSDDRVNDGEGLGAVCSSYSNQTQSLLLGSIIERTIVWYTIVGFLAQDLDTLTKIQVDPSQQVDPP